MGIRQTTRDYFLIKRVLRELGLIGRRRTNTENNNGCGCGCLIILIIIAFILLPPIYQINKSIEKTKHHEQQSIPVNNQESDSVHNINVSREQEPETFTKIWTLKNGRKATCDFVDLKGNTIVLRNSKGNIVKIKREELIYEDFKTAQKWKIESGNIQQDKNSK